jgi:hypothetical protein
LEEGIDDEPGPINVALYNVRFDVVRHEESVAPEIYNACSGDNLLFIG